MLSCTTAWNRCTSREPLRHQSDSNWQMTNGTKLKLLKKLVMFTFGRTPKAHWKCFTPCKEVLSKCIYIYTINLLEFDDKLAGSTILNVWTCVSFLATPPYSAVVENTFCTNPLRCLTDRQPSKGFSRQRKRQQQIQFDFSDETYVNDK